MAKPILQVLDNRAIQALQRMYRALRLELNALKTAVGFFTCELDDTPKKPKCTFVLGDDLTTSTAQIAGTIEKQYGYGISHKSDAILLNNMPTHAAGVYEFFGDEGDKGRASYTGESNIWEIDIVECP